MDFEPPRKPKPCTRHVALALTMSTESKAPTSRRFCKLSSPRPCAKYVPCRPKVSSAVFWPSIPASLPQTTDPGAAFPEIYSARWREFCQQELL